MCRFDSRLTASFGRTTFTPPLQCDWSGSALVRTAARAWADNVVYACVCMCCSVRTLIIRHIRFPLFRATAQSHMATAIHPFKASAWMCSTETCKYQLVPLLTMQRVNLVAQQVAPYAFTPPLSLHSTLFDTVPSIERAATSRSRTKMSTQLDTSPSAPW